MKIGVVGLGYIGSVTAGVLAEAGNSVIGIEIDAKRLAGFKSGEPPIYEPGLKELIEKNHSRLEFSSDYSKLADADIVFLAVQTPTVNERIDLSYIFDAAEKANRQCKKAVLVIKSTVIPGTARELSKKISLPIVSNPEFTREGTAVEDTRKPDRVVIGAKDSHAADLVGKIWSFTGAPLLKTTNENAELIKYASNSFLATKISFINEIANLCESIPGADVEIVAKGMGYDKRIAPYFLKAGIGYGGSCFPKDTSAIASFAKELQSPLSIVESAIKVNSDRIERIVDILKAEIGKELKGKRIAVLGLAFKDDTDDIRGSQPIRLIERLLKESAAVNAYDPRVKIKIDGITRFENLEGCIKESDAVIVATEWGEFSNLKIMDKFVLDAKRILNPANFNNFRAIGLSWER